MSVHSPIDNKVPDHAAWLGQTFTLNTIIQKYSPEYPDQEKDQEKQKRLHLLFYFFFLWRVLMRLFLHFSEVIRIASESLSMYQNIHIVELRIILFNVNHCTISESQIFYLRKKCQVVASVSSAPVGGVSPVRAVCRWIFASGVPDFWDNVYCSLLDYFADVRFP